MGQPSARMYTLSEGVVGSLAPEQVGLIALGGTVGAGLFLGIGDGLRAAGLMLPGMFAAAAALAGAVAVALGEMATAQGGNVTFVGLSAKYLGRRSAFVQGWGYWASAVLACMAQLTAAGRFMADLGPIPHWAVAALGLALLALVNEARVRTFGTLEAGMALLKIALLLAVIIAGAAAVLHSATALEAGVPSVLRQPLLPQGAAGLLAALPLVLFAFGNTELVALASVDLSEARRTLTSTVNRFVARLALLHVGVSAALLLLLSPEDLQAGASPFVLLLTQTGVPGAQALVNVALVCVMLSSCNAGLYGAARALEALATAGCAPSALAIRAANGSPRAAIRPTVLAVAGVIGLSSIAGERTFALLLGAAATFGLVNWGCFLIAHRRFRRASGRGAAGSTAALAAATGALAALAAQSPLRPAVLLAIGAIAILALLSKRLADLSDRQRGKEPLGHVGREILEGTDRTGEVPVAQVDQAQVEEREVPVRHDLDESPLAHQRWLHNG